MFFEVHAIQCPSSCESYSKSHILKFVFPYLKENLYKDLAMTDVCDFLGMSRRAFERSFKQFFGLSPAIYFKHLKMVAIHKELLKNRDLNINEILKKYTIPHVSHFGQYYKKVFSETMSQTVHTGRSKSLYKG